MIGKMRNKTIPIALLSLGVLAGCGRRVGLEYKFNEGDVLRYWQITSGRVETTRADGRPRAMDYEREEYYTITIGEVDRRGTARASVAVEAVVGRGDEREFLDFSDRPILMTVSRRGEMEAANREEAEAVFRELGMPRYSPQFFPVLPERRVRAGDTWSHEVETTNLLFELPPVTVEWENRMLDREKTAEAEVVAFRTRERTVIPLQEGDSLQPRAEVSVRDFDSTLEFVTYFDRERGRPVRITGEVDGSETRAFRRVLEGWERSWEVEIKKELLFELVEATAEAYEVWREQHR